jgi:hypothetical protein
MKWLHKGKNDREKRGQPRRRIKTAVVFDSIGPTLQNEPLPSNTNLFVNIHLFCNLVGARFKVLDLGLNARQN